MTTSPSPESRPRVLLVEDEDGYREYFTMVLAGMGCEVRAVETFAAAREALLSEAPRLVLLDWQLPDGEGVDLLPLLREHAALRFVPVIVCTARKNPADFERGIAAGAYFYLAKPCDGRVLKNTVTAALELFTKPAAAPADAPDVLPVETAGHNVAVRIRTFEDVRRAAPYLARFFPEAYPAQVGLHELLINAIEHGNLGIDFAEKSRLMGESGMLARETARRLELPEYRERFAIARLQQADAFVECVIEDMGAGFDFTEFLHIKPERAELWHGKGITIAREMAFDELEYTPPGNRVRARTYRSRPH